VPVWPFLFFQFHILCSYYIIFNCLNCRILYSRRQQLDALFLTDIFRGRINCHLVINAVDTGVPTRKIREIFYFQREHCATSIVLQLGCAVAADNIQTFRYFCFSLLEDASSIRQNVYIRYTYLLLFSFCPVVGSFFLEGKNFNIGTELMNNKQFVSVIC
jgi:hypothetical protein